MEVNMNEHRHSKLIMSIMICASTLMLISPTMSAFADDSADNQHVNASVQKIQQQSASVQSQSTQLKKSQQQVSSEANTAQSSASRKQQQANDIYTESNSSSKNSSSSSSSNTNSTASSNSSTDSDDTKASTTSSKATNSNLDTQMTHKIKNQMHSQYSQTKHGIDAHKLQEEEHQVNYERTRAKTYEQQAQKDAQLIKKVSAQQIHEVVPVPKQDETPLPSKQYTVTRSQSHIANPMLLTNHEYQQYHRTFQQNGGTYKNTVPMTKKTQPQQNLSQIKPFKDFSKSVLRYKPYVDKVCKAYHIQKYDILMLAIMQNESKGQGKDVMQSSESAGLRPNTLNPQQSIEQAVKYMSGIISKAQQMDINEHKSSKLNATTYHHYATDDALLAQTYNFGKHFLDYVSHSTTGYNVDVAQRYSKNVIAPRLGNKNDTTYAYNNDIARAYGKKSLYKNGGNYLYGPLVEQYTITGFAHPLIKNLMQYVGKPYVFGGKNPKQGFDDSGIISYGLRKMFHIEMPSDAIAQWHATQPIPSINDAKPGDLIFFKGTYGSKNFISHVEIVVDRNTMFGADGSGIGFHNIHAPYWQAHFAGVHRIPQAKHLNQQANHKFNQQIQHAIHGN